jgi:hypothetical protein
VDKLELEIVGLFGSIVIYLSNNHGEIKAGDQTISHIGDHTKPGATKNTLSKSGGLSY